MQRVKFLYISILIFVASALVIGIGGYVIVRRASILPAVTVQPLVGGDKDVHGCIGSAGYSWCEIKQKCLRVWEESCAEEQNNPAPSVAQKATHMVLIQTNMGNITIQTYDTDAPKTVQNFITLAQKGFYNGLIFHRVVKGFVIQAGDPNGDGTGGPGYKFEDELNPATQSYKDGYQKGVVAMANSGSNTNGSQFFIMLADMQLRHAYTIFGKVIKGQDIVDAIGNVAVDANDKPLKPVVMQKVVVQ